MWDRIAALKDKPWTVGLIVGLAAFSLFAVHLGRPSGIVFDEVHYVPAARDLLAGTILRNTEHPMVAKEIIAAGIALFGDNPWGWRFFPAVAGAGIVVALFALVWLMLGRMRYALFSGFTAAIDQMLFVQARIAMLDIFLALFLCWAIVFLLWAMRGRGRGQVLWRWIMASALLGLAVGVKWAAIPYVAMAGAAFVFVRARDARRDGARGGAWVAATLAGRGARHWTGLATVPGLVLMGVVSVAVYFTTFVPAFFIAVNPVAPQELIRFQFDMYRAQTAVLPHHTYQSDWWSWPLMLRPIWYFYEYADGAQRGILLLGNPLIMWGGVAAVLYCLWAGVAKRAMAPLAMALLWIASVGIYAIIPKSLGFYYYYLLSALFLSPVLAVAFWHADKGARRGREEWFAAGALLLFVYFYPILSAAALSGPQAFTHWTWFLSWR